LVTIGPWSSLKTWKASFTLRPDLSSRSRFTLKPWGPIYSCLPLRTRITIGSLESDRTLVAVRTLLSWEALRPLVPNGSLESRKAHGASRTRFSVGASLARIPLRSGFCACRSWVTGLSLVALVSDGSLVTGLALLSTISLRSFRTDGPGVARAPARARGAGVAGRTLGAHGARVAARSTIAGGALLRAGRTGIAGLALVTRGALGPVRPADAHLLERDLDLRDVLVDIDGNISDVRFDGDEDVIHA